LTKLPRGAVCFPDKMAKGNALDENENIIFDGCSVVNVKSNFKSFIKGEGIRILRKGTGRFVYSRFGHSTSSATLSTST
jgi:hypothetical protein